MAVPLLALLLGYLPSPCADLITLCFRQGTKVNSRGKEVPHGVRLYSIASSRYGDNFDGKTTTLCVRRATYWCSELNAEDPAKKGICSNFLCDAAPGTEVMMTGKQRRRSQPCSLRYARCDLRVG
jgi:hypothetical protein